jgi:hypothetical protein
MPRLYGEIARRGTSDEGTFPARGIRFALTRSIEVTLIFATDEVVFLPGNQRPGQVLYPLSYAGTFIRRQDSNLRPPA